MAGLKRPELGVCLEDLRLEVKEAMERARGIGFRAIDVPAVGGPISSAELSRTGQRHLLKHLSDLGLRMSSLRGPVGGAGYADAVSGERRLDSMRGVIRLAAALGVPVVSTAAGGGAIRPDDASRLREALTVLADDADRCGVSVAIETAGLPAAELQRMLAEINCPALAACCDTGAMLIGGDDPHALGVTLPGRIRLARARDAVPGTVDTPGHEVSLGEGRLDPARFLAALNEACYWGDIILSRTAGANPVSDLQNAKAVFERLLA